MNKHINKNKKKVKYDRKYLGITVTKENYRELMQKAIDAGMPPRHEINYHTRHLKAYLKGKTEFRHGYRYSEEGKIIGPAYFKVMEELIEIPVEG